MKKLLGIIVLGLLWCNTASALPKCTGTYGSLLSWAWTNCYGKATFDDGSSWIKFQQNWKMLLSVRS